MENLKVFFLGILATIVILMFLGAVKDSGQIGRYQISAWAGAKGDSFRHGYYVLDTRTGEVINPRTK